MLADPALPPLCQFQQPAFQALVAQVVLGRRTLGLREIPGQGGQLLLAGKQPLDQRLQLSPRADGVHQSLALGFQLGDAAAESGGGCRALRLAAALLERLAHGPCQDVGAQNVADSGEDFLRQQVLARTQLVVARRAAAVGSVPRSSNRFVRVLLDYNEPVPLAQRARLNV